MLTRIYRAAMAPTLVVATVMLIGCETQPGRQLGAKLAKSANVVSVSPDKASPGSTVRVEADLPVFGEGSKTTVEIDGVAAKIINDISDVAVEVIVPLLNPGEVDVQVVEPDKLAGDPGTLEILAAKSQQLVMLMQGDQFEILDQQPRAALPRRSHDPGGKRIQVEVYNGLGRLVFSDVQIHPTDGRLELFDAPDSKEHVMVRVDGSGEGIFSIQIPNIPGGAKLLIYELPDGVHADSDEATRTRKLINDISIPDGTDAQG
jgi:hypothetical protein